MRTVVFSCVPFNQHAASYDASFTHTVSGMLMRRIVHDYVDRYVARGRKLEILELNCGTGEDAIWFSKKGHIILATDASEEMLRIAKEKSDNTTKPAVSPIQPQRMSAKKTHPLNPPIDPLVRGDLREGGVPGTRVGNEFLESIDFRQIPFHAFPKEDMISRFDLIFSNFGGLNCIDSSDLMKLLDAVAVMLKPGGHFAGVLMPKYCLWEMIYFPLKGQWGNAFRRNKKGPVKVMINDSVVETWYYSPAEIKEMIGGKFRFKAIRPVGFVIPPSSLDPFFRKHRVFMKLLEWKESLFHRFSFVAGISDHFLFHLEKKV